MTTITPISVLRETYKVDGAKAAQPSKTSESDTKQEASKVSLSTVASSNEYPVDTAKVEKFKQQIENGTFKVDSSKVADKILESLRK